MNLQLRNWIIVFSVLFFYSSIWAQITMEKGKFPFTKVVEWPNRGTLFMGDDPTGNTNEKNISFFNNQGRLDWNKSIYPGLDNTHLILSGSSNYIYFVDDLKLYNDRTIRYNQMNISGSIEHTDFNVLTLLKKIGFYNSSSITLTNIVNTSKALVFYFQLPLKDKGVVQNIFITITHHNNRAYILKGPPTELMALEEGLATPFNFAGADSTSICFSRVLTQKGKGDVEFAVFSPKAKARVGHTYTIPEMQPITSIIYPASFNGLYYLNDEQKQPFYSKGKGIYIKGHFYYVANDAKDRGVKIYGIDENGKFEQLNNNTEKGKVQKKYKNAKLTFVPWEDKIFIGSELADNNTVYRLGIKGLQKINSADFDFHKVQFNPSVLQLQNKTTKFVQFIKGKPYFINTDNLGAEEIIFKP